MVIAGPAAACWGSFNEGAAVTYQGTNFANGGSSREDLWQPSSLPSGTAIIHPLQLLSNEPLSSDFFGWGTARGIGTGSGHLSDCPDDYTSGWKVYADGRQFGQYWCRQLYGTLPNVSANQIFKFNYITCPYNGLTRFVMYLNGAVKTCALIDSSSGILGGGGEAVTPTGAPVLDIDVDFEDLHYHQGTVWYLWGPAHDTNCLSEGNEPPYFVTTISNVEFEIRSGI